MRKDGIAYVQNPPHYYPPIDYMKLSLPELKKKFIDTCGKSGGLLSNCSKCTTPCEYGKRATQLLANTVYNDPPIPLYGGKTLIEKAKEENMKRRLQEQEQKMELRTEKIKTSKDGRVFIEDWYEKATASGDKVKWVMETYNISRTKAKNKIYNWEHRHKETDIKIEIAKTTSVAETDPQTIISTIPEPVIMDEFKEPEANRIESKMDALMKLQEKHKKVMQEYLNLYNDAKEKYELISKKIDILCSAMDIMNE